MEDLAFNILLKKKKKATSAKCQKTRYAYTEISYNCKKRKHGCIQIFIAALMIAKSGDKPSVHQLMNV